MRWARSSSRGRACARQASHRAAPSLLRRPSARWRPGARAAWIAGSAQVELGRPALHLPVEAPRRGRPGRSARAALLLGRRRLLHVEREQRAAAAARRRSPGADDQRPRAARSISTGDRPLAAPRRAGSTSSHRGERAAGRASPPAPTAGRGPSSSPAAVGRASAGMHGEPSAQHRARRRGHRPLAAGLLATELHHRRASRPAGRARPGRRHAARPARGASGTSSPAAAPARRGPPAARRGASTPAEVVQHALVDAQRDAVSDGPAPTSTSRQRRSAACGESASRPPRAARPAPGRTWDAPVRVALRPGAERGERGVELHPRAEQQHVPLEGREAEHRDQHPEGRPRGGSGPAATSGALPFSPASAWAMCRSSAARTRPTAGRGAPPGSPRASGPRSWDHHLGAGILVERRAPRIEVRRERARRSLHLHPHQYVPASTPAPRS